MQTPEKAERENSERRLRECLRVEMSKPQTAGDGCEEEEVNNPCEGNSKRWISNELNAKG